MCACTDTHISAVAHRGREVAGRQEATVFLEIDYHLPFSGPQQATLSGVHIFIPTTLSLNLTM